MKTKPVKAGDDDDDVMKLAEAVALLLFELCSDLANLMPVATCNSND